MSVEVKTGQYNYIRQQIEDGHVLRQAELHKASDLSFVILSKDFKKTATETTFRERLRKVNTEALALLPTKKILDRLCIRVVEVVRDYVLKTPPASPLPQSGSFSIFIFTVCSHMHPMYLQKFVLLSISYFC